jgi:hypothetical protein
MPLQYPADYDLGYIGFTCVPGVISAGIAYAEHWHRLGRVTVTHTFVVTGNNECVEAHIDEGVARVSLDKYLRDPRCRIYFKRPRGWTQPLGARIAAAAATRIGARYNTSLILAEAAADTWLGHWCNRLFRDWPNRILSKILDQPNHWICSQLVADALAQQPEFKNLGILRQPLDTIDPQQLFDDPTLFENHPPQPLALAA